MYSQASLALSDEEKRDALRLTEVGKDFLLCRAKEFIVSAAGRPLLYAYSSDGTPMTSRSQHSKKVTETRAVRRSGGSMREFLV